jgi:ABC-type nitrate/sulfonate/bicarbonate transport system substrate-binding protein
MKAGMLAVSAATAWVGLLHPAEAETVALRFGQIPSTVRGTSSVYLHLAEQKGFFARENIKLERISIPGGTDKMVIALEQGAVDVTQTATPYLI